MVLVFGLSKTRTYRCAPYAARMHADALDQLHEILFIRAHLEQKAPQ